MRKRKEKFPPPGYVGIVIYFAPDFHKKIEKEVYEDRLSGIDRNKSEAIARYAERGYHVENIENEIK